MECSTKVFGEGALGIKAQMSSVTACLVWAFPANSIKNAKKLSGGLAALNAATHGAVARAIENKDLDTTSGSTLLLNATDAWAKLGLKADRLLLVCCGEEPKVKPKQGGNHCSKWISAGLKSLIATTAKDAVWVFDDFSAKDGLTQVRLLVQLAREQVYKFGARHPQFKTKPAEKAPSLKKLVIASGAKNNKAVAEAVAEGRAIANGMDLAKDLGNLPPNICNPTYLSTSAKKLAKELGLKVEVLGRKEIEALKMGAFLAVTQGAVTPPQFIVIRHQGGRATDAPVVLVGKGITFDTGGISLKHGEGMDKMK